MHLESFWYLAVFQLVLQHRIDPSLCFGWVLFLMVSIFHDIEIYSILEPGAAVALASFFWVVVTDGL